jgi:tagaturonate reductase
MRFHGHRPFFYKISKHERTGYVEGNHFGVERTPRPIRVMQYGEGNFLRAFVDYMLDIANEKGLFDGDVAIVKPIAYGSLDMFRRQSNLYTVCLRGKAGGKVVKENRVVTCVGRTVDAQEEYEAYIALAKEPELQFIVSNTTGPALFMSVG